MQLGDLLVFISALSLKVLIDVLQFLELTLQLRFLLFGSTEILLKVDLNNIFELLIPLGSQLLCVFFPLHWVKDAMNLRPVKNSLD